MGLVGQLVRAADVTPDERDAMFALMERHYENVARNAFAADLREKDWVIRVLDPLSGQLCGFSTQMLLDATVEGRRVRALFSGDTIVSRDRWGDDALPRAWGRLALRLIDAAPGQELYWFLVSKGYKTYRFLPLFFHEYYPRRDARMPARAASVLDALARLKFGGAFEPTAGVVRGGAAKDRLRPGVAEVTPARLRDPDVRYFVERNPGHAAGDELCCLAPLTRANFTRAAYRVIGEGPAAAGVA
jgi:hypothetical protein